MTSKTWIKVIFTIHFFYFPLLGVASLGDKIINERGQVVGIIVTNDVNWQALEVASTTTGGSCFSILDTDDENIVRVDVQIYRGNQTLSENKILEFKGYNPKKMTFKEINKIFAKAIDTLCMPRIGPKSST